MPTYYKNNTLPKKTTPPSQSSLSILNVHNLSLKKLHREKKEEKLQETRIAFYCDIN